MNQPRATSDLMNEAHRRALRRAPPPGWHPLTGGLAGAAAFAGPMILFGVWGAGVSLYALMLNAIVGFALPFFWLKRRKDAYDRAWTLEFEALKASERSRQTGSS
jgi:hypothetical protein